MSAQCCGVIYRTHQEQVDRKNCNVSLFLLFRHDSLAHLVLADTCAGPVGVFRSQLVLDLNIEVATVLLIRAADQRAVHLLTLLDGEHVL